MAKLNLGAGRQHLPGWTNVDLPEVNLLRFPWPWEDESMDELLASHILEHFTKADAYLFLSQCYRILKPGGWLHLAVPDMDKFIQCRLAGDFGSLNGYAWTDLNYFMGGNETEGNESMKHRYMWCHASLTWTLGLVGFENITHRYIPGAFDNPGHAAISLYMDGQK